MNCNQFDVFADGGVWIVKTPEVDVKGVDEDVLEDVLEVVLVTVFGCMLMGIFKSAGTVKPKVFWCVEI
jgi:hypothetical protein